MGKKKLDSDSEGATKKRSNTLRNIFIIILFLSLGVAVGIYGTKMYLEAKEDSEPDIFEIQTGPDDITDDKQTKELVDSLYAMLNKDSMFYTSKGVVASTIDNTTKLTFIYNYLIANKSGKSDTLSAPYAGSNCDYEFLADASDDPYNPSTTCTVVKISRELFTQTNKTIFNDDLLDTSVEFKPSNGKKCVVATDDNTNYLCGNIINESGITGGLESKFTINKVTRDEDGTIVIYEKGYLIDKRSNVLNENSQYDNYYLHSSDSKEHYFELKNADNLTFKHTFKTNDRLNYFYVSTELVK